MFNSTSFWLGFLPFSKYVLLSFLKLQLGFQCSTLALGGPAAKTPNPIESHSWLSVPGVKLNSLHFVLLLYFYTFIIITIKYYYNTYKMLLSMLT